MAKHIFRDLKEISDSPMKVEFVDLSMKKIRRFPEELYRCPNLAEITMDEDYFSEAEKKVIESRLVGVRITWTLGLYIDGKHGR